MVLTSCGGSGGSSDKSPSSSSQQASGSGSSTESNNSTGTGNNDSSADETDNSGAPAGSSSATARPVVTSLVSNGQSYGEGRIITDQIVLEGTSAPQHAIEVWINNNLAGSTVANAVGFWRFNYTSIPLSQGAYSVKLFSFGMQGETSQSATTFNFYYDPNAPAAPIITQISNDSFQVGDGVTADNTLTISGTSEANLVVRIYLDNVQIGTATANSSGQWTFDYQSTTLADGSYQLTADTYYLSLVSAISTQFPVTVDTLDPPVPVITGISPDNGGSGSDGITNTNNINIAGTSEANSSVTVTLDGVRIGSTAVDGGGNWNFNYTAVGLGEGAHSFVVSATDGAGNRSSSSGPFTIEVDTLAPSAATNLAFSPDAGTVGDGATNTGAIVVSGTAEAGASVELFQDGVSAGITTVDGTGNWSFDFSGSPLADGSYVFTAVVTDVAGNGSAISADLNIIVSTLVPATPALTSITTDTGIVGDWLTSDGQLLFAGTSPDPNVVIRLYINGSEVTSGLSDGAGNWSIDYSSVDLATGTYSVSVLAESVAGTQSSFSSATSLYIDKLAPNAPVITSISSDTAVVGDGVTSDATLTIIGTAENNATIALYVDGVLLSSTTATSSGNWSLAFNPGADGNYVLTATAQDLATNISVFSTGYTVVLDTAAPATPVISGFSQDTGVAGDWITSDNQLDITGSAEASASIEVFIDAVSAGSVSADGSGNWSFGPTSPLADGSYNFTAQATDTAGNVSVVSGATAITVDGSIGAPTIVSVSSDTGNAGDGITYDNQLVISGTTDANDDVEVFVDGVSVGTTTANGAGAWSFDYTGTTLADGSYVLTAQASDNSGNISVVSADFNLTIDSVIAQPVVASITTDTATAADGITSDNQLLFNGTAEIGASVEVFMDAGSIGTTTADGSGNWSFNYTGTTLADGSYVITAQATDIAGNVSVLSANFNLTVDATAPAAPAVTAITNDTAAADGITSDNQLLFSGTAEANVQVEVFVDAVSVGTTISNGGGTWSFDYTGTTLADNSYVITAQAIDTAGNASVVSGGFNLTVDTSDPASPAITTITDDNGIAGDGNTNDTQIIISGTAEANATVTVLVNAVSVGTTTANGAGAWSFDYTATTLAQGSYSLTATATDTAGNSSVVSGAFSLVIDTVAPAAPTISAITDDTATAGDGITSDNQLVFSGTAENNSIVEVFIDAVSVGTATTNGSGNWSFDYTGTALADNTYAVTATAMDAGGNTSVASGSFSLQVDTTAAAPVISTITNDTGTAGDGITSDTTLVFSGTAEADSSLTLLQGGLPIASGITVDGSGNWTYDYTGTALSEGSYTYNATVIDVAGNSSVASASFTVVVDTSVPNTPVISGITTDSNIADGVTNDNTLVISGTSDASESVTLYIDAVSVATVIADGSGNWTVNYTGTTLADNTYSLTAVSTDSAGNASVSSAAFALTIDTSNPAAPAVTGITNDTGTAGDGITSDNTLFISGTAEADATVTILLDGGSIGTATATGGNWSFNYTGTTLADNGYIITATAQDLAGNSSVASADFNITIDTGAPAAPAVTTITTDTGAADGITSDTTLTIAGTGEIGATIDLMLDASTIGAPVVDGSGNWSFDYTGTTLVNGSYTLTATQTDTAGLTSGAGANFDITIDTNAPTVNTLTPTDNGTNVAFTDNLVIDFDEPVYVQSGNLVIYHSGDDSVFETIPIGDARITGSGTTTLTINPTANLVGGTSYYVQIATTALDDLAGNSFAGITDKTTWNFTTAATAITTFSPLDNATGVALNASLAMTFNEIVYTNVGNFIIRKASDNSAVDTIDIASGQVSGNASNTITVTQTGVFEPNTAYYVELDAAALQNDNTVDFAGISGTATWNFTSANVTVPTVTGVTSSTLDGTYGTSDVIVVQVNFSENVNVTGVPTLTLDLAGIDAVVNYSSGTGTSTLVFNYTVSAGDSSADLDYVATNSLSLGTATIRSDSFANADLTLPNPGAAGSLGNNKNIVVSGTAGIDLATFDSSDGFIVLGAEVSDFFGHGVSGGGDINGDGFDDLVVGVGLGDAAATDAGAAHVIYGKAGATRSNVDLSTFTATNGFTVTGTAAADYLGDSVNLTNDLNGDGYDEMVVLAPGNSDGAADAGTAYVIWGKAGATRSNIATASFGASDGFKILGYETSDLMGDADAGDPMNGQYMDSQGDFNGDGIADLILGHHLSDVDGTNEGVVYVIYGKTGATRSDINLNSLGTDGFVIRPGTVASGYLGKGVRFAGDFNGDGYDDIVVGAGYSDQTAANAGEAYVIFGSGSSSYTDVLLSNINGTNGFKIVTSDTNAWLGSSVASGDVNGDGLTDLIIANTAGDTNGRTDNGAVHIIYGSAAGAPYANVNVDSMLSSTGYTIYGAINSDFAGHAIDTAGDFDGDGIDDIVIGTWVEDTGGGDAGAAWIVYGTSGTARADLDLLNIDSNDGFMIVGAGAGDYLGRNVSHGDINGDGFSDLILTAMYGDKGIANAGEAYVIWGKDFRGQLDSGVTGTGSANKLVGTSGADTITGNGGADSLIGGSGDDTIIVSDMTFQRIDGGRGEDTLALSGTAQTLNIATMNRDVIRNIEVIDLGDNGNTLTLNKASILGLSIYQNSLRVDGGVSDFVTAASGALINTGVTVINSQNYDTYVDSGAVLYVHEDIDQSGMGGFNSVRKLTFNASSTVSNFPVLVRLTDAAIIDATQADASDLRFVDADGVTVLPYEIERWDQSANRAEVWVLVPEVASGSSDYITMYYDDVVNGSMTDAQDPVTVWADYTNVYHMHDGGIASGAASDSTIYANDAVQSGTVSRVTRTGFGAGRSAHFTNSESLTVPYDVSFNVSGSAFSVSGWMERTSCASWDGSVNADPMVRRGSSGSQSWKFTSGYRDFIGSVFSVDVFIGGDSMVGFSGWSNPDCGGFLTLVYDPSANPKVKYYKDGVSVATTNGTYNVENGSNPLIMGDTGDSKDLYLDEIRHTKTALSANYIDMMWDNQRSGSTFITITTP